MRSSALATNFGPSTAPPSGPPTRDPDARFDRSDDSSDSGQSLSAQHLELHIKQAAEYISDLRKLNWLLREYKYLFEHLRDIPSSGEQQVDDWNNACCLIGLKILEAEDLRFAQLEPDCYRFFDETWLKEVKQLKAYYVWLDDDKGSAERNYHAASASIRSLLSESPRAPEETLEKVRDHIRSHYLKAGNDCEIDEAKPATAALLKRKAYRIWEMTGSPNEGANWHRARLYTTMFYENIIPASNGDESSTILVLKALQFGKSKEAHYNIINFLETAISISVLDKEIVRRVLAEPARFHFSMMPVDNWPRDFAFPERCRPRMRYDASHCQITYEGVMDDAERLALLDGLGDPEHRRAIEALFLQSRLEPASEMIL